MYQQNGTARACDLVRKYGVRWIVIGERERRRYGPAAVAPAAGRKVFDSHGTEVYDVAGVCGPPAPTGRLVP